MTRTNFSVQLHHSKNAGKHFDLRVQSPVNKYLAWSWALPKRRFPEVGEKVLCIRTQDHSVGYMMFKGVNSQGDKVEIYDHGTVEIPLYTEDRIYLIFNGKKVKESYLLVKIRRSSNWLMMRSAVEPE